MVLRETIKKLLREEMDGKSKKDYSKVIEQLLESLIERKKHIICDIEVTAPWNRETIEPGKSFEDYKVLITFIGGFGTKYFPITQSVHIIYDKIIDEIWQTIYGFMGFPVDIYTKKVESCENIEKGKIKEGELTERCWKGYTQKGMKTMFGKRYPNCVKKKKVNEATIKPHSVRYFTKEEIANFEKILNKYMSKYEWWKGITIDGLTYNGNRKDIDLSADLNVDEEWGANQWGNTFYTRPFPGNDELILLGEILDGNTIYEFREDLANIFIFTFGLPLSSFPVNEIRVRFIPNTDEEKYAVIEITKPIARMEPKYYFQEVPFWKTKEDMIYINKGSSGKKTISTKNIKVLKTFSDRNSPEMKKYLEKLRNQEK